MRYLLTLAYHRRRYVGWQRQPTGVSVQATVEQALSTLLGAPIEVVGCGRTDAGVHAAYYVAHFDCDGALPATALKGLNSLLPADVAAYGLAAVPPDAHARFDAFERSYVYRLALRKNPFQTETAWFLPRAHDLDAEKMQAVADLLPQYQEFLPFCKTHSGLKTFHCTVKTAEWKFRPDDRLWTFHITANRFLRGMVRLVVGACVRAGLGQIEVDAVRAALDRQEPLGKSRSAPAHGLFLTAVKYPFAFEDGDR
jgi:tRNA pseudouridine38-40 synthase